MSFKRTLIVIWTGWIAAVITGLPLWWAMAKTAPRGKEAAYMDVYWFICLPASALVGAILTLRMLVWFRQEERRSAARAAERFREETEKERRRMLDHQENLGNRIYNALIAAGEQNPDGRIRVERLKNNGHLGYSIIVGWEEKSSATMGGLSYAGYPVMQVDINLAKPTGAIHTFKGPYGPDHDHKVEDAELVISQLIELVRSYSPYRTTVA